MNSDNVHTLVASMASGRYALEEIDGRDITSGDVLAIQLGGQWVWGRVEYDGEIYVNMGRNTWVIHRIYLV